MKKITRYFTFLMLTGLMSLTAFAQSSQSQQDNNSEPRSLNDKNVSDRLQKDLFSRNTTLNGQPISWFDTGDGYYGTYSNNDQNYMTRYDKNGTYLETMTKKEWNDNVPASLRSSFDASPYKSQEVKSYWEVSDPGKKGYYMEFNDNNGKVSRVWGNDKGEFSNKPYSSKSVDSSPNGSTPKIN